jgi:predicted phosphodiesterase
MRIAVLADIHGNFEAFAAVLEMLQQEKVRRIIHLGDVVGYGPDPVKCLELFMAMKGDPGGSLSDEERTLVSGFSVDLIMGNHDAAVINFTDISYFNRIAYEAIIWTKKMLNPSHQRFIKSFPYSARFNGAAFYHSTPQMTENWYYLDSSEMARESFPHTGKLTFVAHTHKPYLYIKKVNGERVSRQEPEDRKWVLDDLSAYIINPGSVGQPRDGNYLPSFIIWDTEEKTVQFYRIDYDVRKTQKKLSELPLPYILAERLLLGK